MNDKFLAYFNVELLLAWGIKAGFAIIIFVIGRLLVKTLVRLIKKGMLHAKVDQMLIDFFGSILNILMLLVVLIAALNQLGIDTTSLIALLGAAGLAVGLALQGSLSNFAAGVMLIVFKPFKLGDFVEAGGAAGTVEQINIFNTVMKTPDNKKLIVPNGQIYAGIITNYSAEKIRRIDMVFGVSYNDDIKQVKVLLKKLLLDDVRILSEPEATVVVGELAESSVNFNVRPWVKSSDYWAVYCDFQEKVKLAFDEQGISIPYPHSEIYINKVE